MSTEPVPALRAPRAVTDGYTVIAAADLPASPERVMRALTTNEQEVWWGADDVYRMRDWTADVREGGRWRIIVSFPGGPSFPATGEFLEVDLPRRLVHTRRYEWEHPDLGSLETIVTHRLDPIAAGTRLTVRHDGFAGRRAAAEQHADGWERVLVWLGEYLAPGAAADAGAHGQPAAR